MFFVILTSKLNFYFEICSKYMLIDTYKHKGLRKKLVKELENKGIEDKNVLHAIELVPRHVFFETALIDHAYEDKAFPIGEGQTISQPYTVAVQTELLEIKEKDKILEIGTGSGYQCAVLVAMGADVYSIEFHEKLFKKTKDKLNKLNFKANLYCGDGSEGLPKYGPYDKILLTAACPDVKKVFLKQLKVGGILVYPEGDFKTQVMKRVVKISEEDYKETYFGQFKFVPLLGVLGLNK
jgi:protein-L-isoaspartate(D-aspartate) O-methyltransferase